MYSMMHTAKLLNIQRYTEMNLSEYTMQSYKQINLKIR